MFSHCLITEHQVVSSLNMLMLFAHCGSISARLLLRNLICCNRFVVSLIPWSLQCRETASTSVSVLELSLSAFVETYAMLVQVVKGVKLFEYTLDGPSTFVTPMYPHLSNLAGRVASRRLFPMFITI